MIAKTGVHAGCKAQVQAIQAAYDALLAAAEAYRDHLETLVAGADPADESDRHLTVVANLQRNTVNGLIATLDTEAHDDLIRLSDRVIRFKHWEDGVFV